MCLFIYIYIYIYIYIIYYYILLYASELDFCLQIVQLFYLASISKPIYFHVNKLSVSEPDLDIQTDLEMRIVLWWYLH